MAKRGRPKNPARAEAEKQGRKRYFTGNPCARGHVAERFVSSAKCVECTREDTERIRQDPAVREEKRKREREHKRKARSEHHAS